MAGYLIPGVFASVLLWTVAFLFLGPQGAWAVSVVACATGLVWIWKKRQEGRGSRRSLTTQGRR